MMYLTFTLWCRLDISFDLCVIILNYLLQMSIECVIMLSLTVENMSANPDLRMTGNSVPCADRNEDVDNTSLMYYVMS